MYRLYIFCALGIGIALSEDQEKLSIEQVCPKLKYWKIAPQDYSRSALEKKCPGFGKEWVMFPDENENPTVTYLKPTPDSDQGKMMKIFDQPSIPDNVDFILYTRENPNGTYIKSGDVETLQASTFDKNKDIKFVTHGFRSSGSSDTCQTIKDGFLEKYDANVFVINWKELASGNYFVVVNYPEKVGDYSAKFLNFLVENGADSKNVHVVGHSLGAHLSGFFGKNMIANGRKIARITGLDPAWPLFNGPPDQRLSENDADFVDIIHTCGGALGVFDPIGHADFYPNQGTPVQPGCDLLKIFETCSHGRSWKYFAESVVTEKQFIGYKCDNWVSYKEKSNCESGGEIMGNGASPEARGKYFLSTAESPPFALGPEARFQEDNNVES